MGYLDFNTTRCEIDFRSLNVSSKTQYAYTGDVFHRIDTTRELAIISFNGCEALCGRGRHLYDWEDISQTITTWILPMTGLILQAPFESNKTWPTLRAICRWIGSPILSLAYILWNIKVTGECALIVDMATNFGDLPRRDNGDYADMRDSFYILSVMNQYIVNRVLLPKPAELLLRAALFRDDLVIKEKPINEVRRKMAAVIRNGRKKGVVPIFVSQIWFFFSLGLSVQQAFDKLGNNATAHNLAMGLLLGWLPVLILCSIIDRNPATPDDIMIRINTFLENVRRELRSNPNTHPETIEWLKELVPAESSRDDFDATGVPFFIDYGGQGRKRWHYGIAHGILQALKDDLITEVGRGWLYHPKHRDFLIERPDRTKEPTLYWFDFREAWQILYALMIVGFAVLGAFYISYFTPTVGLGCRSGGYMIFFLIAFAMLLIELGVWWGTHRTSRYRKPFRYLLRFVEVVNAGWLVYILVAQTFGFYRSCRCMASMWSKIGGYIDFNYSVDYTGYDVTARWATGTMFGLLMMMVAIAYIVSQWMMQSHIWTEDFDRARRGLLRTRRTRMGWEKTVAIFRAGWKKVRDGAVNIWSACGGRSKKEKPWRERGGVRGSVGSVGEEGFLGYPGLTSYEMVRDHSQNSYASYTTRAS